MCMHAFDVNRLVQVEKRKCEWLACVNELAASVPCACVLACECANIVLICVDELMCMHACVCVCVNVNKKIKKALEIKTYMC